MSTERGTKYGHLLPDDDEQADAAEERDSDETPPLSEVEDQYVTVLWRTEPRDLKFRVLVAHGDHDWCPFALHADRAHRIAESNQFDPMGRVEWRELPTHVQHRVVEVVAGVERIEELTLPAEVDS